MTTLNIKIINNIYDFHCLENSWEEFRTQEKAKSPCLSWLWINLWCKHYIRKQDKLFIHIYYHNEKIIGIIPVYLKKITLGYQLRFLATGEPEESEICSEFQDFMIKSEYEKQIFTAFNTSIKKQSALICIVLTNVLKESRANKWFLFCQIFKVAKTKETGVQFLLPVYESADEQIAKLSSKTTRRQAKKYLSTPLCYCIYVDSEDILTNFFNELKELHNRSWNQREKKGVFENNTFCEFHLNYIKKCYQQGKLVLFKVICEKKTVAIFYGIVDGDTLYYYQSGISRESILPSVGTAMHIEALNYARLNNIKHYDLMKGSVDSYKQRIAKSEQEVISLNAFKKNYTWLPLYWKVKEKLIANIKGNN